MSTAADLLRLAAGALLPDRPELHTLMLRAIERGTPLQADELRGVQTSALHALANAVDLRRILVEHADAARALDPKSDINTVIAWSAATLRAIAAVLPARSMH